MDATGGGRSEGAGEPEPTRAAFTITAEEVRQLGEGDVVVRDGVLGALGAAAAHADLRGLAALGALTPAAVGRLAARHHDPRVRGDRTTWIERDTATPGLRAACDLFEAVREAANRDAWLGLRAFEVQAACYPGDGAAYARHRDAFHRDSRRRLTAIWYGNPEWSPAHGGVLRTWEEAGGTRDVDPILDRLVLFLSAVVEHAVLPAHADRYAVTAWYRAEP